MLMLVFGSAQTLLNCVALQQLLVLLVDGILVKPNLKLGAQNKLSSAILAILLNASVFVFVENLIITGELLFALLATAPFRSLAKSNAGLQVGVVEEFGVLHPPKRDAGLLQGVFVVLQVLGATLSLRHVGSRLSAHFLVGSTWACLSDRVVVLFHELVDSVDVFQVLLVRRLAAVEEIVVHRFVVHFRAFGLGQVVLRRLVIV